MSPTVLEIHGERFAIIPEADYLNLLKRLAGDEEAPLPASLFSEDELEDEEKAFTELLGQRLRAARNAARLTQAQLAKKLRKSQALVSAAERGTTEVGTRYMELVLKACKLPSNWKPPA